MIDEDLGKSADSASERSGFQRLVAEVSLAHVGMILGLDMSRLARSIAIGINARSLCLMWDADWRSRWDL